MTISYEIQHYETILYFCIVRWGTGVYLNYFNVYSVGFLIIYTMKQILVLDVKIFCFCSHYDDPLIN